MNAIAQAALTSPSFAETSKSTFESVFALWSEPRGRPEVLAAHASLLSRVPFQCSNGIEPDRSLRRNSQCRRKKSGISPGLATYQARKAPFRANLAERVSREIGHDIGATAGHGLCDTRVSARAGSGSV